MNIYELYQIIKAGDENIVHIHWGFWEDPADIFTFIEEENWLLDQTAGETETRADFEEGYILVKIMEGQGPQPSFLPGYVEGIPWFSVAEIRKHTLDIDETDTILTAWTTGYDKISIYPIEYVDDMWVEQVESLEGEPHMIYDYFKYMLEAFKDQGDVQIPVDLPNGQTVGVTVGFKTLNEVDATQRHTAGFHAAPEICLAIIYHVLGIEPPDEEE